MRAMGRVAGGLMLLAGAAQGLTTDDYYSVQSGSWHEGSTWTSAPAAFGYPRAGDNAFIHHAVTVTDVAACADMTIATGKVEILGSGQLDVFGNASVNGGEFTGTGIVKLWRGSGNRMVFEGDASLVACPFFNEGDLNFVNTPSLQLENRFVNAPGGTVVVDVADFTLSGTTGVGTVQNQGTFAVSPYGTSIVDRLEVQNGLVKVGTGSVLKAKGRRGTNVNGTFDLQAGAIFHPAWGDNAYYDGTFTSTGPGAWRLEDGAMDVGHVSGTTTVLDVGGGGFEWRGGTLNVCTGATLENRGEMDIGNGSAQTVYGLLLNKGKLRFRGTNAGARVAGTGRVVNQNQAAFSGALSEINVQLQNLGRLEIVDTPALQLEAPLVNSAAATVSVNVADFNLYSTTGAGFVQNQGRFEIPPHGTCVVDRFQMQDGTLTLGTGGVFKSKGTYKGTNWGGAYHLATGAVYHPVDGGTGYYDGVFTSTGDGKWLLETGALMACQYSSSTTVFNVGGGGFDWNGGTINARPGCYFENQGIMRWGPTSSPVMLQGNFRNQGWVQFGGPSTTVASAFGGTIANGETGVWHFTGGNPVLQGSAPFENRGLTKFLAATTSLGTEYVNLASSTRLESGTTTFAGGFFAESGTVSFAGGNVGGPQGLYLWGPGAVLSGIGLIQGYIYQNAGTLSPGFSPGTLTIGARYEQRTNAVLQIELGGKAPGTEYDRLAVGGPAVLRGALNVELVGGYSPAGGERFDVLTSGSVSNVFRATNLPALGPGLAWLVLYRASGVQLRVASAADADGDGLQDDWEIVHFGDTTSHDGGDEDDDDDGYTDYVEQCLDTQPTNNADFFRAGEIAVAGSNSLLELRTGLLVQYAIEARPDLSDPVGEWTVVDEFAGTGGTVVRTNAADGDLRLYRLKAVAP